MGECGLCAGTLVVEPLRWPPLDMLFQQSSHRPWPCPDCLSTPTTGDIRAHAMEAFRFDVWDNPGWVGPWDSGEYNGDRIPVWIPMGEALALYVLARRLQDSPQKPRGLSGPTLRKVRLAVAEGGTTLRVFLAAHGHATDLEAWEVPPNAPRALQRARSIVLAIEATA